MYDDVQKVFFHLYEKVLPCKDDIAANKEKKQLKALSY